MIYIQIYMSSITQLDYNDTNICNNNSEQLPMRFHFILLIVPTLISFLNDDRDISQKTVTFSDWLWLLLQQFFEIIRFYNYKSIIMFIVEDTCYSLSVMCCQCCQLVVLFIIPIRTSFYVVLPVYCNNVCHYDWQST